MATAARDQFEAYYAEKLWELIPPVYREEDGLANPPDVLRSLVEILAGQAAHLRRSTDRLWEDQFIELCDDWAVPYIADLVGTRLVSALNARGRRVDVAKTIYYRRRKGTPRVLEELISDISGWEGKVVEQFRRLGRPRHGLDPDARPLAGAFTGTPPGGWSAMRRPRGAALVDTAFDEFHHWHDVRRHRGLSGRHGIAKLAFHLLRIPSRPLVGVMPAPGPAPRTFTVDPSGRDTPLFVARTRANDWDEWRSAREWELPAPMPCRLLGHAEYQVDETVVAGLVAAGLSSAAANDLRRFRGVRFKSERELRRLAAGLPNAAAILAAGMFQRLLAAALVPDCGKAGLLPKSFSAEIAPGVIVPRERMAAGNLAAWSATAADKRLVVDPERGRLLFLGPLVPRTLAVSHYYGFPGPIGAGTFDRRASVAGAAAVSILGGGAISAAQLSATSIAEIEDSATYGPVPDKTGVQSMTLRAANEQRPYLRLEASWVLDTGAQQDSRLTLDGLWIGTAGNFSLVLRGDFERVLIAHCTLDPGGLDAQGNQIRPVRLAVEGRVEELVIDHAIVGPIERRGGEVERLCICDSIVQSLDPAVPAIDLPRTELRLSRATIFGAVDVNLMDASEALITGPTDVTNTQAGCFRFSAAPTGSRVPRPFESLFFTDSNHFFTSRRFGDPGFAQLSESAPAALRRGAENGSEMGAYSALLNAIKLDSLKAKIDEFAPFGLIPIYVFAT
jgi:hypothetical protein